MMRGGAVGGAANRTLVGVNGVVGGVDIVGGWRRRGLVHILLLSSLTMYCEIHFDCTFQA